MKTGRGFCLTTVFLLIAGLQSGYAKKLAEDLGSFGQWEKIEITFEGPHAEANGDPNPFEMFIDVIFTGPEGIEYTIPGFYNGNDHGGLNGNIWKVRFSADRIGGWSYKTQSSTPELNNIQGTFTVTETSGGAADFYQWGRLEFTGTVENNIRYLKFRDGSYWFKVGNDTPEAFLSSTCNSYTNMEERKAVVDWLAQRGINSQYVMVNMLGGDFDGNVWPWLGDTKSEAANNSEDNARFDIAKMEQWRELFEYMTEKGVVPYLIFQDDDSHEGDKLRLAREVIARYGYLPALMLNPKEETGKIEDGVAIKQMDPYKHPIGCHNHNEASNDYVDSEELDFTSIQIAKEANPFEYGKRIAEWIKLCKDRGTRTLMVNFDEVRGGSNMPLRKMWWGIYTGGGQYECFWTGREKCAHPSVEMGDLLTQLGGVRTFWESLPFWRMEPRNDLVVSGRAMCLAEIGEAYALYFDKGGKTTVQLEDGKTYEYGWWDCRNSIEDSFKWENTTSGGTVEFEAPGEEWALRIVRVGSTALETSPLGSGIKRGFRVGAGRNGSISIVFPDERKYDVEIMGMRGRCVDCVRGIGGSAQLTLPATLSDAVYLIVIRDPYGKCHYQSFIGMGPKR